MIYYAFPCEQDTLSRVLTASIEHEGKLVCFDFFERGRYFQVVMTALESFEDVLNEIMVDRYNFDGRRNTSTQSIVGGEFWQEKLRNV